GAFDVFERIALRVVVALAARNFHRYALQPPETGVARRIREPGNFVALFREERVRAVRMAEAPCLARCRACELFHQSLPTRNANSRPIGVPIATPQAQY